MFKDTRDGQTNFCSHETKNTSGICDGCVDQECYICVKRDHYEPGDVLPICNKHIDELKQKISFKTWLYWKLTFIRDKPYCIEPFLTFIDWIRYWDCFDEAR